MCLLELVESLPVTFQTSAISDAIMNTYFLFLDLVRGRFSHLLQDNQLHAAARHKIANLLLVIELMQP